MAAPGMPPVPFMPFPFPAPIPAAKAPKRSEGPSEPQKTLYVQNLNEKVKIDALVRDLQAAFGVYGEVLKVYAKKSVKMRGQAFVVFREQESADKAKKDLQGFPLHHKPMSIQYAKTTSDETAIVDGTLEEHKRLRAEKKAAEKALESTVKPEAADSDSDGGSDTGATKRKPADSAGAGEPKKKRKTGAAAAAPAAPSVPVPAPAAAYGAWGGYYPGYGAPQDMEIPNATLFVEKLPPETTQAHLQTLFKQYPGLKEVRTIPGRSDIAFIDYADEVQSAVAKNATNGFKMMDKEIKVTFAKK